jgi:hypothetical protein
LHPTARLNVAQDKIVIGVPTYQNAEDLTPGYLLKLPFAKIAHSKDEGSTLSIQKTNANKNVLNK